MFDVFFNARVGDFGLVKQNEHDKSPDATIICCSQSDHRRRRPFERDISKIGGVGGSTNLVEFVYNLHKEGRLLEAVARIRGEFDEEEMLKVILIELNSPLCFNTTHLLLSLQDSVLDYNEMITISTSSSSDNSFNGSANYMN
ncbi:hypothetical protein MKW92_040586 [Papaver armeniacum]|nr:hypothetical protein MKW92_040586 [Papaver armeniacum]